MTLEEQIRHHMRLISIVEAGIWSTQGMGITFWMMDQRQSVDGHFTIEYVHSHTPETQNEAKALRYDFASETNSQPSTLSNSLLKNSLDYLHWLDHL